MEGPRIENGRNLGKHLKTALMVIASAVIGGCAPVNNSNIATPVIPIIQPSENVDPSPFTLEPTQLEITTNEEATAIPNGESESPACNIAIRNTIRADLAFASLAYGINSTAGVVGAIGDQLSGNTDFVEGIDPRELAAISYAVGNYAAETDNLNCLRPPAAQDVLEMVRDFAPEADCDTMNQSTDFAYDLIEGITSNPDLQTPDGLQTLAGITMLAGAYNNDELFSGCFDQDQAPIRTELLTEANELMDALPLP